MREIAFLLLSAVVLTGCEQSVSYPAGTYGADLAFLQEHKHTIVLKADGDKCQVVLVPDYQGRIMTSTGNGMDGRSFGWINTDHIASGMLSAHVNVFGGEDRFWLGPEGGQYALFFKKGVDFTYDNWQAPAPIDSEPFNVEDQTDASVTFSKTMRLSNYAGFVFDLSVNRIVSILDKEAIGKLLGVTPGDDMAFVGYRSDNTITNTGITDWSADTGLLSIWILGMFVPSDNTTVIIPYRGDLALNTRYFGEIGPDRLKITPTAVYFKGDGQYRCKIGVPAQNIYPYFGSYDSENNVLTIVNFTYNPADTVYVNSVWEQQDNPYAGDVINSYNDGPLENQDQLGPFYELETSSSAEALKPGESKQHVHTTYHFEGSREQLNVIAKKILGVDLNKVAKVFQ